jgi:hypothetical protein
MAFGYGRRPREPRCLKSTGSTPAPAICGFREATLTTTNHGFADNELNADYAMSLLRPQAAGLIGSEIRPGALKPH